MKRWMAVTAAALAAGICMAGAAGMAAPGTARASTPVDWYRIFQSRFQGLFSSIAAISKTNVWAVGELWQGGNSSNTVYTPYVQHFNGSTWKEVAIPGARISTYSVRATSASDVWVFGLTPNSDAVTAAYRWDGARWHRIPVPALTYLQGMVVLGPSNVWAFGDSGTLSDDVFHWNGSKWTSYNLNLLPQDISASSASNVWLAGLTFGNTEKLAAYRWNGSRWLAVSMRHPAVNFGPGVTALSPSNVWIGYGTANAIQAAHWDGHQWSVVTAPGDVEANSFNIIPDGRGGYWWGPFADWTGHAWVNHLGISPEYSSGGFGPIARIPGTSSFLMTAGVENAGSTTEHPSIYRLDLG